MKLKLDEYFNSTAKYYELFDELFYYDPKGKKEVLSLLGINYNSYRVEKTRSDVNNSNISLLLNYFNINPIENERKLEYERIISKIYYTSYYKQLEELRKLLNEIEVYIYENNYLKPILILMKTIGYICLGLSLEELKILKTDLDYLNIFNHNYFTNEFKLFQMTILYYFDFKIKEIKLKNLVLENPKYKWFYLNMIASHYYLHKNDEKALIYYLEVLEEYKKNINVERLMNTISNISCIYNLMGKYDSSLNVSSSAIEYAYSTKKDLYISYLTQHYLFSNYMLDRKDAILDFLNIVLYDKEQLNIVSAMMSILILFEDEPLRANELIESFNYDHNIRAIQIYLNTNNKEILDTIVSKPYFKKIVNKLKKRNTT